MATKTKVEVDKEIAVAEPVKETVKAKRKFEREEQIMCKSVACGEVILVGAKSGMRYTWSDFGDVTPVEYQDLLALKSMNSGYLTKPFILIMDEDLVNEWSNFKDMYEKIAIVDSDALFSMSPDKFTRALKSMPPTFKDTIKHLASQKIVNGSLDSVSKIKALDEVLGTDLMMYLN